MVALATTIAFTAAIVTATVAVMATTIALVAVVAVVSIAFTPVPAAIVTS